MKRNSILLSFIKVFKNKFFVTGILFLIWIIFFDQSNLLDWKKAKKDVKRQKMERQYYQEEIAHTREKLRELRSNRDSLEKFAREQYYYLQDGEEIFIVEDAAQKR